MNLFDFDDMEPTFRVMIISIAKLCIQIKSLGEDKNLLLGLVSQMWEVIEKIGEEKVNSIIDDFIKKDLPQKVEAYIKKKENDDLGQ